MAQLLSDRYMKAVNLVADLFRNEQRALTGLPYVVHLYGVCHIVEQLTDDEDVHLAALLHDVLEDIPTDIYSAPQLEADFGPRVLELIQTVSHNEPKYGKDQARTVYLQQLKAGSTEACLISGADMMHNMLDILSCYKVDPQRTAQIFGGAAAKRREWFFDGRYQIISGRLGSTHSLVEQLGSVMQDLRTLHKKIM